MSYKAIFRITCLATKSRNKLHKTLPSITPTLRFTVAEYPIKGEKNKCLKCPFSSETTASSIDIFIIFWLKNVATRFSFHWLLRAMFIPSWLTESRINLFSVSGVVRKQVVMLEHGYKRENIMESNAFFNRERNIRFEAKFFWNASGTNSWIRFALEELFLEWQNGK